MNHEFGMLHEQRSQLPRPFISRLSEEEEHVELKSAAIYIVEICAIAIVGPVSPIPMKAISRSTLGLDLPKMRVSEEVACAATHGRRHAGGAAGD